MSLRSAASEIAIPPLGLAWLALAVLIGAFVLGRRWRERAMILASLSIAGLLVLAMPAVGSRLLISLEEQAPEAPPAVAPQAIVVLAAEAERTQDGIEAGPITLQRLLAAARLYRRTGLPVLVSGGPLAPGQPPIAQVMARVLKRDFGIPVQWQETVSETTWQNARDSAAILLPRGITSVYVVTHAWHERRALIAFRHFGLSPTPAPTQLDAPSNGLVPTETGLLRSYLALHEWLGIAVYALQARLASSNNSA